MTSRTRYLVTGGAGFIGSSIVEALVASGAFVRVIDNLSTGSLENLDGTLPEIEFLEADLVNPSAAAEAVDGISVVFHEAALPSVPRSVADPVASNQANVDATLNLLVAARDAGVRRLVYASSSSVYGDTPTLPKVETMAPKPLSPYAVAKLAGEQYCQVFAGVYGLETVSLRYFNVFGPKQNPDSQYSAVIPLFIKRYLTGNPPTIDGDGEQTRAFAYIDNVVQANLRAAEASGVSGEVFNISVGHRMSINDLDQTLRGLIGVGDDVRPPHGPSRVGDITHSFADLEKAKRLLGYEEDVSTEEGLRRTVEWYKQRI